MNRERIYATLASAIRGGRLIISGPQADALTPDVEALLAEARQEWIAEALSDEAVERACEALWGDECDRPWHWKHDTRAALRAALGGGEK